MPASEVGDSGSIPGEGTKVASCAQGASASGGEAGDVGSIPTESTRKVMHNFSFFIKKSIDI